MNRLVALCVLLLCILGHNGLLYAAASNCKSLVHMSSMTLAESISMGLWC